MDFKKVPFWNSVQCFVFMDGEVYMDGGALSIYLISEMRYKIDVAICIFLYLGKGFLRNARWYLQEFFFS